MSVFIHEPDAFDKLIKVEGGSSQDGRDYMMHSFEEFLKKWKALVKMDPGFRNITPELAINTEENSYIEGHGGWNRYVILNTGEIMLHESFVRYKDQVTIERARKAGFKIFPTDLKRQTAQE